MDWTMVANAGNAEQRLRAVVYLCRFRYELDARTAGIRFKKEARDSDLCRKIIAEMREELSAQSMKLEIGTLIGETEVRKYFSILLHAFDEAETV